MKLIKTSEVIVKKSRFIGYLYEIDNKEEAKDIIEKLHEEHKKARHIPYAYKVNGTASKSDDKEPSNTAGMPIYNLLERKNMNNSLIAVVRYFGGTKLGAGGLFRAYMDAANKVCDNNEEAN